jgi:hypothetical protein
VHGEPDHRPGHRPAVAADLHHGWQPKVGVGAAVLAVAADRGQRPRAAATAGRSVSPQRCRWGRESTVRPGLWPLREVHFVHVR